MAGQDVKRAVAQAGNRTCVELSSARSTRTRFEPFSAAISTSSSSSRSCRGAIRTYHASTQLYRYIYIRPYDTRTACATPPSERLAGGTTACLWLCGCPGWLSSGCPAAVLQYPLVDLQLPRGSPTAASVAVLSLSYCSSSNGSAPSLVTAPDRPPFAGRTRQAK
eukprot:scaffold8999_cov118-Isochrysis_galbana.AAC.1